MRRVNNWILGLLAAAVLTMTACGGGDDRSAALETEASTTETAAAPRTLPEQGPLPAGEYETRAFEPAFSFIVGEGWEVDGPELQDIVGIVYGGDSFLGFARPEKVFDSSKPAEQKEIPAPETVDEWVAWYRENPYLDLSKPEPVTVGSASGVRFDATVTGSPKDYPEECGEAPCVPAFPGVAFYLGEREEELVLEVGGETVIVGIAAPAEKLEDFAPKAQEVLDTVRWKAEP